MDEAAQDDEDVDMQQTLFHSIPANDICPITDKDMKPFPIMSLPTEIRLEIYRACLTRPYDILLSKRDKPQPTESDADCENGGRQISEDQIGADETEEANHTHRISNHQATTNQNPGGRPIPRNAPGLTRRSSLAHGLRSVASRTTRSLRLASNRSAHTPSTSNNDSEGIAGGFTQVGASRTALRSSRSRQAPTGTSTTLLTRNRNVSVPVNEPPRNQNQDPLLVNILQISKEVYKEARSVLYNENRFNLDLNTAMSTLSLLHQRSRRQIKHVELEIPTYNEILERFQETVRLSLRYCTGLKILVIHMPFTLPGADGSGTTGNTTVYANGFDILRWLPQDCNIILRGNICSEIEVVVNKHLHLAKTLDKVSRGSFQYSLMLSSADLRRIDGESPARGFDQKNSQPCAAAHPEVTESARCT